MIDLCPCALIRTGSTEALVYEIRSEVSLRIPRNRYLSYCIIYEARLDWTLPLLLGARGCFSPQSTAPATRTHGDLESYLGDAVAVSRDHPVVISKFIQDAKV